MIQEAITDLHRADPVVRTTVFAEPGRQLNKKWSSFFACRDITFRPVARNSCERGEANDDAIASACERLMEVGQAECVALLISDCGYLDTIRKLAQNGMPVVVLTLADNYAFIQRCRTAGVRVTGLTLNGRSAGKVKAVLHEDGSGHVELGDPHYCYDSQEDMRICTRFLHKLGYVGVNRREYLTHSVAKFWYSNGLGSLTIFPQQCGIKAVCEIASSSPGGKWNKYNNDLALLLPVSSPSKLSKDQRGIYGSGLSRQLFQGGGPFMLKDSPDVVYQALEKLGYLDAKMNAELSEAMLVFVNAPQNHYRLRKQLKMMPHARDTAENVQAKLRSALMSHLSDAKWRMRPSDTAVRQILVKKRLLSRTDAPRREVFNAMAKYAETRHLPRMKTYNGRVFRILRALDATPNQTGVVEFNA